MSKKYDSSTWYDKPITKLIRAKKRLEVITKLCNNGKIVDLGCGGGQQLNQIKKRYPGAECWGIDLSEFSLSKARELNKDIRWIKADAENTELKGNDFDVVVCSEVIEHTKNPKRLIDEVLRISKDNAKIIFSIPNMSLVDRMKYFGRLFFLDKIFPQSFSSDEWHLRDMNIKIFRSIISKRLKIMRMIPIPNRIFNFWYVIEMKRLKQAYSK